MLVIRVKETGQLIEAEPRFNCGSQTGFYVKGSSSVYGYEDVDVLSYEEIRAIISLPEHRIDDDIHGSVKELRRKLAKEYGYSSRKTV